MDRYARVVSKQHPSSADPAGPDGAADPSLAGAATGPVPASLRRRFGALVVDWILCLLIAGLFTSVRGSLWPSLVLVVEYAFFVGLFGQTPGMRLARIRCVPVMDGAGPGPHDGRTPVIGVPRAALRGLLLCLVVPGLIMDERQRGLHDRAARSMMVAA